MGAVKPVQVRKNGLKYDDDDQRLLYFVDLSFNNIESIEGLDRLTKIQDLTLYNNRIQKLENMDALTELHVFSIGNNDLNELENVSCFACHKLLFILFLLFF